MTNNAYQTEIGSNPVLHWANLPAIENLKSPLKGQQLFNGGEIRFMTLIRKWVDHKDQSREDP